MNVDKNLMAQADALLEGTLAAAHDKGLSGLDAYDAAEQRLIEFQAEMMAQVAKNTDLATVLFLTDVGLACGLALDDVRGRRAAFQQGVAYTLLTLPTVEPLKGAG